MNTKILTLTVFGDEKAVREVLHYTRASREMQQLYKRMYSDNNNNNKTEFRDAHAAVVAYARSLARARGCWTYNSAHPARLLDVTARAALGTADSIRQTIRRLLPSNA